MLDHSCVHDAGTGSTTDWYERWQWAAVQVQRNIASGLRPPPPYSGDSQAGTGPQQAVTIHCQVSQDPYNRDIEKWGLMWAYEPFFIDRYP